VQNGHGLQGPAIEPQDRIQVELGHAPVLAIELDNGVARCDQIVHQPEIADGVTANNQVWPVD